MNGSAQPPGSRRVMSTGAAVTLIAAGAILRFAVATTSTHGLNVHVVGVVLILAGALGLVLSLLVWGPLSRRRNRPVGYDQAAPPPGQQQRAYPGQPSAVGDPRAYPGQPSAAGDPRVYQDQPPA